MSDGNKVEAKERHAKYGKCLMCQSGQTPTSEGKHCYDGCESDCPNVLEPCGLCHGCLPPGEVCRGCGRMNPWDYETRAAQAQGVYQAGMKKVAETPEPEGQKFPCGSRVRIADDLGPSMRHFESGVDATVEYVYAHAYGGSDVKSYCLNIDGCGSVAWYYEHQLTAI